MSYILEALKKAERERSLGRVPTLETSHAQGPPPQQRYWLWLMTAALLANALLVTAYMVLSRFDSLVNQTSETASTPIRPEPSQAMEPARTASAEVSEKPTAGAPTPASTVKPTPLISPRKSEPPLAKTHPSNSSSLASEAPLLQSLPSDFRRSFAELNLDVHVYSDQAAQRFVLINSKRYQEGDRLREGPSVETITSKGTILRYQGQRFLLPLNR